MPSNNNTNKRENFSRRMTIGINTLYYISVIMLVMVCLYMLSNSGIVLAINMLLILIGLVITAVIAFFVAMIFAYIVGTMIDLLKNIYNNWRNRNE